MDIQKLINSFWKLVSRAAEQSSPAILDEPRLSVKDDSEQPARAVLALDREDTAEETEMSGSDAHETPDPVSLKQLEQADPGAVSPLGTASAKGAEESELGVQVSQEANSPADAEEPGGGDQEPPLRGEIPSAADRASSYWKATLFLHTGWTGRYDGNEAPYGGHAYLKEAVGVEASNFKPVNGRCYGYAPVSRTSEGRKLGNIPEAYRTLKIEKLGASPRDNEIHGITIVWTARHPIRGPVVVGLFDNATVYRFMPGLSESARPFIAMARVEDCHLVPERARTFEVIQKRKGFPGMAAAWFAGLHADGPARDMLADLADYLPKVRRYTYTGDLV